MIRSLSVFTFIIFRLHYSTHTFITYAVTQNTPNTHTVLFIYTQSSNCLISVSIEYAFAIVLPLIRVFSLSLLLTCLQTFINRLRLLTNVFIYFMFINVSQSYSRCNPIDKLVIMSYSFLHKKMNDNYFYRTSMRSQLYVTALFDPNINIQR